MPSLPSLLRCRPRTSRAIGAFVAAASAFMLVVHCSSRVAAHRPRGPHPASEVGMREGDEWQGLYFAGTKAGWLHLHKEKRRGTEPGWRVASELHLDLLVLGKRQQLALELRAELDPALLLRSFTAHVSGGDAGELRVRGEVQGHEVALRFASAGEERPHRVRLERPPTLELAAHPLLAAQGLAVGKELAVELFDPLTQAVRVLRATVIGEEDLLIMNEQVHTFVLQQDLDGMALKAWVTPSGEVMREELPLGLLAVRETEEEARRGRVPGPPGTEAAAGMPVVSGLGIPPAAAPPARHDVVQVSAVDMQGDERMLAGPRVRLRLPGLGLDLPGAEKLDLDGGRQRLHRDVLTVQQEPMLAKAAQRGPTLGAAAGGTEEEALQPEPLVQSDHPELREGARQVVAKAAGRPAEQVRLLVRWVHDSLEKTGVVGVPSALEVLRSRRGDCTEHATLFVALARAAGIPARLLAGLVYLPRERRFFYHAWAEVLLGDGWVEVDPTFGEAPASAARVRIVRGGLSRQVELLRVLGRLRTIEVLDPAADGVRP